MKTSFRSSVCVMAALLAGCSTLRPDADVIIIGAGIAGVSAALEASDAGARVMVLDANSVGGGHAVMAGGLFLVGTPLQAAKGVQDSPELAFDDIMKWGEDSDPRWVRRYVEASRPEVHDWLGTLGVDFRMLLPAPGETSVPRFHFAKGAGLGVIVPMMRQAFSRSGIRFAFNTEVTSLASARGGRWQVGARDARTSTHRSFIAPAVVIATGGFENDLDLVTANWPGHIARPERLLRGAGRFADGDGIDLGRQVGAQITRLDHQTIFVTGLPDPRDPSGRHGLLAQNAAAIKVDRDANRFVNESAARKVHERRVLGMPGQGYWMIFDSAGLRELRVRGAPWLTDTTLAREILDNAALLTRADSIAALGAAAGLPPATLGATIARFNAAVRAGDDQDFGRFGPGVGGQVPLPLEQPPFYAMRLYPMTRKSMGGLAIDDQARVRSEAGEPIPGLFAAGEATGVAGINGSYGGSGTFLGPSVLTGRIAGRTAASLRAQAVLTSPEQRTAP
ncbi:MAG: FAD-dependent oxidoreductase, partial [Gammaproteobacteria bacterium]|nr:FAD-dependent oxidoreductase [Gammaproteobacteria bacterium]